MKGVTLATFRRYVKTDGTKPDLRAITDQQIATVCYRHYWAAVNAQALPLGVDYAVFDFAGNSGPRRAAKYLQSVVGAKVDGRVGPETIAAVSRMEPAEVINPFCDARVSKVCRAKLPGGYCFAVMIGKLGCVHVPTTPSVSIFSGSPQCLQ